MVFFIFCVIDNLLDKGGHLWTIKSIPHLQSSITNIKESIPFGHMGKDIFDIRPPVLDEILNHICFSKDTTLEEMVMDVVVNPPLIWKEEMRKKEKRKKKKESRREKKEKEKKKEKKQNL